MDWYLETFKKYAEFSGRACRAEYWSFFIINMVAVMLLTVMDIVAGTYSKQFGIGLLGGVYSLILFLPSLAVSVRRLHDTERSAWWLLLAIIPLLGLVLVVFYLLPGTQGANEYGDDPLAVPAAPEPVIPAPAPPPPPPAA